MPIKTILTVFGGDAADLPALDTAFLMTRAHDAVLRILHMAEPPILYTTLPGHGRTPAGGAVDLLERNARLLTEAAQVYAQDAAVRHGIPLQFEGPADIARMHAQFRTVIGEAAACLPEHGRTVDLIITTYDNQPLGDFSIVLSGLFQTGRPMLLIPRHRATDGTPAARPNTVVIAWDGSISAARAVRDAVPLMQDGASVYLLCAEEGADTPGEITQSDMMAYLHSHSVAAEALHLPCNHHSTGDLLLDQCRTLGAELLVMGAYGHGHIGEMILGGTTNHVLKHTRMPLLIAH